MQELQDVVLMLLKIVFQLSGKVVALQCSTAKAYLCSQVGTASCFLSRLACCMLNLAKKHIITLIPVCIPTHFNVQAKQYDVKGWFQSGIFFPT